MTSPPPANGVELYWLPLGTGDRVVQRFGRMYEAVVAARQHRNRCALYHAALEVHLDGDRYVIESAPAWDRAEPNRGLVVEGPVGLSWLGRSKWFRYEVRRRRNGTIPDASAAVDNPRRLSADRRRAQRVLNLDTIRPPAGGRAPGWSACIVAAERNPAPPSQTTVGSRP